jgi:RNase P/RNase MRP subunit p29
MEIPPFPGEGEKDGGLIDVSVEELLLNRRGIAGGNNGRVQLRSFDTVRIEGRVVMARPVRRLRQGLPK